MQYTWAEGLLVTGIGIELQHTAISAGLLDTTIRTGINWSYLALIVLALELEL